ncbi:MAG TPA: hypothetical protein VFW77_04830 [Candidatus Saccharimonadales bacterium]|nr:hypothetical protein [Candidatus Saccharimonadales bacterium]
MSIELSHYTPETLAAAAAGALVFLIVAVYVIYRLTRKRVRPKKFRERWRKLQKKLPNRESWLEALIDADNLLDEAMKKRNIKGETMGERLVNAQKDFKDKDEVWFGHKLCKRHHEHPELKLKKDDVKRALVALRQALKDLGAI